MAKILIVDDEHEFRSMLRTKLEDHGHRMAAQGLDSTQSVPSI